MQAQNLRRVNSVPTIVRIVIKQAVRHRAQSLITEAIFQEQMRRLAREELEQKALILLIRDLPGGRTRLLIREEATNKICDMLDFAADGSVESDFTEAVADSEQDLTLP